jgi:ubiquinone/menaquinone biosynthesis C-methylase UbiE
MSFFHPATGRHRTDGGVMAAKRVDYDGLAATYDQRFGADSPGATGQALRQMVENSRAGRVLEVGCGTGHWLETLAPVSTSLFGLDPSAGMLRQARTKQIPAHFSQGYGEQLPFANEAFEVVFCVNALHHFAAPQTFIADAVRVLGKEGRLAVVGGDPHRGREQWYVYRYFDGTYETDRRRYPTWEMVSHWMEAAGFRQLEFAKIEHIIDHKQGAAVFTDPYLRKESSSQLALLTDEAYEQGLRRIREVLAEAEAKGETLLFETDLSIFMLSGRR